MFKKQIRDALDEFENGLWWLNVLGLEVIGVIDSANDEMNGVQIIKDGGFAQKWIRKDMKVCDNDGCNNMGGRKCPCKKVRYCSSKCQREHWKKQHRGECSAKKKA